MPEHLVRKSIGLRLRGVHAQGHERRETDSLVAGEEATGQRSTNCHVRFEISEVQRTALSRFRETLDTTY